MTPQEKWIQIKGILDANRPRSDWTHDQPVGYLDFNRLSLAVNTLIDSVIFQNEAVGIGFIYFQIAGQPEPTAIFPGVWQDVSNQYPACFFRVAGTLIMGEGENAVTYTRTWDESIQQDAMHGHRHGINQNARGEGGTSSSGSLVRANRSANIEVLDPVPDGVHGPLRIAHETRVVNKAMKVWKRVA